MSINGILDVIMADKPYEPKVALTQVRQSETLNLNHCVNIGRYTTEGIMDSGSQTLHINFHDDMEDFRFVYLYLPGSLSIVWEYDTKPRLNEISSPSREAEDIENDLEGGFLDGKQMTFEEAMRYFDSVIEEYRSRNE